LGKWLGIADQTVFGTPVTPPTIFLDLASIDLKPEREIAEVVSSNIIGPQAVAAGGYKITGDLELIPNSVTPLKLLKYLFGTPTSTQDGSNPRWKHVYLPSDVLKFGTLYKVDESQPDLTNCLQYISSIVTECRLEAAVSAFVSLRLSVLGEKDAKVSIPTLGTLSTIKQFFSMDSKMYWDVTGTLEETNINAVSLTYTREIPDDFYAMNSAFLKGFLPGDAKVEGSADILWKDWVAYEKFWGAASGPINSPANCAMMFDFLGPSLGGTGDYAFHRMKWSLPALSLTGVGEPFEGRNRVIQTVNFKGGRGSVEGGNAICAVRLVNDVAGPI